VNWPSPASLLLESYAKSYAELFLNGDTSGPEDMNVPGWRLHPLAQDLAGHYSVRVNGNWRMTFTFDGPDAILVDYQDCH